MSIKPREGVWPRPGNKHFQEEAACSESRTVARSIQVPLKRKMALYPWVSAEDHGSQRLSLTAQRNPNQEDRPLFEPADLRNRALGAPPRLGSCESPDTSELIASSLTGRPAVSEEVEPESIALATWEEVQGEVVRAWNEAGRRILDLRTPCRTSGKADIRVPMPLDRKPHESRLPVAGDLIAVLRTDLQDRPFVIRFLDLNRESKSRSG